MAWEIKELLSGEGRPKICVPIIAENREELQKQLLEIQKTCFLKEKTCIDLLEWRVDFWESFQEEESRIEALEKIHESFPTLPLLFTFRRKEEGGEKEVSPELYEQLCLWAMKREEVAILDLELSAGADRITAVLKKKPSDKQLLLSSHDFDKTPDREELLKRMGQMDRLGADILKLAVMPHTREDVLRLLEVTIEMKKRTDKPIITMSMGKLGQVSRLLGGFMGSAVTFAAAGRASAPGQMEAEKLYDILTFLT